MASHSIMNAAHRIQALHTQGAELDKVHIASMIEEELGFADAIAALRRCDKLLEQLGVTVTDRDFLVKAIAKLEGIEKSTHPADTVIGTAP